MKRLFEKFLILIVVTLGVACTSSMDFDVNIDAPTQENPDGEYIISFGTFDLEDGAFVTDSGLVLFIDQMDPSIAWSDLEAMDNEEGRALINYTLLGMLDAESYTIRLNRVYDIFVSEAIFYDSDEDGGVVWNPLHPAMPYQASYSGGYINVNVYYPALESPASAKPEINLYCNMATSTDDTLMMQLYYKGKLGFDSAEAKMQSAWFSFRVPDDWEEEAEDAEIFAFQWCWWLNENDHSAGVKVDNMTVMFIDSHSDGGRVSLSPVVE